VQPETNQQRYDENLKELHAVEVELVDAAQACARYNATHKDLRLALIDKNVVSQLDAMRADPVLHELEHRRDDTLQRRNKILEEHARLKMALGLTR
jgi:hypothetical protein